MRLVLVDDEERTLNGLAKTIMRQWPGTEALHCAHNGLEALSFIEENAASVDMVITDIQMPRMNGIDLIKAVKRSFPHIRMLALSAYSDYSYVREALLCGAFDYLLKPYDTEQFTSVMRNFLENPSSDKKSVRELDVRYNLTGSSHLSVPYGFQEPFFLGLIRWSTSNIQNAAHQIIRDLQTQFQGAAVVLARSPDTIMFICDSVHPDRVWLEKLDRCLAYLEQAYGMQILLAYSPSVTGGYIQQAEQACREAVNFMWFNHLDRCMDADEYAQFAQYRPEYRIDSFFNMTDLVKLITKGDSKSLNAYLDNAWANVRTHYARFVPDALREQVVRFFAELEAELGFYFAGISIYQPDSTLCRNIESYVKQAQDLTELEHRTACLVSAIDVRKIGGTTLPQYIIDSVYYIASNYMRPMTLQDVAKNVYVNNWYLSTQFKKFTGISISEYIGQVRIYHAMRLLRNPDLKIAEVSSMVGFADPTYFSTVFKRLRNLSPRDYQVQYQQDSECSSAVGTASFATAIPNPQQALNTSGVLSSVNTHLRLDRRTHRGARA